MFHRGQRVVVIESSAKKRAHPNVGDVGYIGSAFLFYRERFILMDAEFFSYPGYSPGERKSEKKRFILDLGMTSYLKRKLMLSGHSRNWYTHNQCVVNLNPISTSLSVSWNDWPTLAGLWPLAYEMATFSKGHDGKLDTKVKIPIGRISSMNANKYPMGKHGINDMTAWMRLMSPVIDIAYRVGNKEIDESDDVGRRLFELYHRICNYVCLTKEYGATQQYLFVWSDTAIGSKARQKAVITAVRHMQAISAMQRLKQEDFMTRHYVGDLLVPTISNAIRSWGVKELINGDIKIRDGSKVWDIVASIMFRAMIMKGNTYNRMSLLKHLMPFDDDWFQMKSAVMDKIKEEAESDSAALARIFDGTLIS